MSDFKRKFEYEAFASAPAADIWDFMIQGDRHHQWVSGYTRQWSGPTLIADRDVFIWGMRDGLLHFITRSTIVSYHRPFLYAEDLLMFPAMRGRLTKRMTEVGGGTKIHWCLEYTPFGGALGMVLDRRFGEAVSRRSIVGSVDALAAIFS